MPKTKEELQETAQLVRIHEANCGIEHPSDQERNFRLSIMKKLGTSFKLIEMRTVTIAEPGKK